MSSRKKKKGNNFYFSWKVRQSRYEYYFYTWNFLMVKSGKNIFQSYFLETGCRRKKRYDFPIDFSPTCISLNIKFSIPTKNLESFSHFSPFLINHLVWRAKKCRFIWSSDRLEQELHDRCGWEKRVTVADFKRHPRQKYGSAQRFFWWFPKVK